MPLVRRKATLNNQVLSIGISLNLSRKVLIVFSFILLLFMILEIWASNRLSTFGEKISQLNAAQENLSLENQLLQDQIAAQSSLNRVSKYSPYLGLQDIKSVKYIEPVGLAYK